MLAENIRALREARGLSQKEFAVKLNVVRQTVSKWERGRSVPDADLLVALAEALGASVSDLLGEVASEPRADELRVLSEKLEVVNLQLARRQGVRRRALVVALAAVCAASAVGLALLAAWGSPYAAWDYVDPERAVLGVLLHALEWVFVRVAPLALVASAAGLLLVLRRR